MIPSFDELIVRENLVELRKNCGLTQKQVESKLNWRALTVYDYESGRLKLTLEVVVKLAYLYGTTVDQLLKNSLSVSKKTKRFSSPALISLIKIGLIGPHNSTILEEMRNDPIIISEIGIEKMESSRTLLQLLLDNLTETQQHNYVVELYRYINSLISVDKRIDQTEVQLRDAILKIPSVKLSPREQSSIHRAFEKKYLGKSYEKYFPRQAFKHFLVWVLYLISMSDGELDHREKEYIEEVAEHIKLKESSLDFIKKRAEKDVEDIY